MTNMFVFKGKNLENFDKKSFGTDFRSTGPKNR